jgi:peptide/nickel transport system permease protein
MNPVDPTTPALADNPQTMHPSATDTARQPREFLSMLRSDTALIIGCLVVFFWVVAALSVPLWAAFDPIKDQNLLHRLSAPSGTHWFGTDNLGRDVFTRVLYGARLTLPIAGIAVMLSVTIGCFFGAIAGFLGGLADEAIMRVSDLFLAFPAMVLALAIAAALGPSSKNVVIAIVVVTWPEYTRLMRGQILSIRGNLHVLAARSVGCSNVRIFRVHVLPFGLPPIIVKATVDLGMAILLAAGLSFIGVGAAPPAPEWGAMVSEASSRINQWWLGLFPGLAILSIVLAVNFIGDALRDRYDPQLRAQRRRRTGRSMTQRLVLGGRVGRA